MTDASIVRPLLTIAIPTYNRENCLAELLSILAPQVINETRVELIISDDASKDNTTSLVHEYQQRGLAIRYYRNETNLGMAGNFLQCYQQATGKYFWLFGDDDVIDPGGVKAVLDHLQDKEYDLVYVECYPFYGKYQTPPARGIRKAVEVTDVEYFVRHIHVFFTFMSGNIVNKDRVEAARTGSFSTLVKTTLLQLGWIYTALNGFQRGLYIHDRIIAERLNNTGGYTLFKCFGPDLNSITHEWIVSSKLKRLIMNGTVQRFWPGMLINYRSQAAKYVNEVGAQEVLMPVFGGNFRYWLSVYPIMVLPSVLASAWFFGIRILNRIDKAFGYLLLR